MIFYIIKFCYYYFYDIFFQKKDIDNKALITCFNILSSFRIDNVENIQEIILSDKFKISLEEGSYNYLIEIYKTQKILMNEKSLHYYSDLHKETLYLSYYFRDEINKFLKNNTNSLTRYFIDYCLKNFKLFLLNLRLHEKFYLIDLDNNIRILSSKILLKIYYHYYDDEILFYLF